MSDLKTIAVKPEIYSDLLRLKKHPRQSFNDIIEELLLNAKKSKK